MQIKIPRNLLSRLYDGREARKGFVKAKFRELDSAFIFCAALRRIREMVNVGVLCECVL